MKCLKTYNERQRRQFLASKAESDIDPINIKHHSSYCSGLFKLSKNSYGFIFRSNGLFLQEFINSLGKHARSTQIIYIPGHLVRLIIHFIRHKDIEFMLCF